MCHLKRRIMTSLNKQAEFVQVQVQVKRPRRFKAGSEKDSSAVNLSVEIEDKEESQDFKLRLTVENSSRRAD